MKSKKITALSVLIVIVAIVGVSGVIALRHNSQVSTAKKSNSSAPMFAFSGAKGWRKGPSNATSMALFNSTNPAAESPCFTSTEYYKGTVDVAVQLHKNQQTLNEGGYTVASLGTKALAIRTAGGNKQYDLHLSRITSPGGANKIMGGNALGYLQLSDGYLKIYGNCNTAEELPRTFPALQAVSVNA